MTPAALQADLAHAAATLRGNGHDISSSAVRAAADLIESQAARIEALEELVAAQTAYMAHQRVGRMPGKAIDRLTAARRALTEDTPTPEEADLAELRAAVAEAEKNPRPIATEETHSGTPSLRFVPNTLTEDTP